MSSYQKQYPDFHLPEPRPGGRATVDPALQAAARKKTLGILAIVLIALIAVIAMAGLDNLPRRLQDSVKTAQSRFRTEKSQFQENAGFIQKALRDEPDLFRTKVGDWNNRLTADQSKLSAAESELGTLAALVTANKRSDADKVEQGLKQFESDSRYAAKNVEDMRVEAARWIGYKRELPARLSAMARAHDAIDAFDIPSTTPTARKALVDWPAKKADLDGRLTALAGLKTEADTLWTSTAAERAKAGQPKPEGLDYAGLFQTGDRLDAIQGQLRDGASGVNTLASQLYDSWDKLLMEVDDDNRQHVRLVRTHFADASLTNGTVTKEEKVEPLDSNVAKQRDRNAGLVIERKPAGKYDSEAEHTAQAPAYAYIAPPGQSNSYGAWNNGIWTWLAAIPHHARTAAAAL